MLYWNIFKQAIANVNAEFVPGLREFLKFFSGAIALFAIVIVVSGISFLALKFLLAFLPPAPHIAITIVLTAIIAAGTAVYSIVVFNEIEEVYKKHKRDKQDMWDKLKK
jgi:cobalamin biosynthesis protein CobD/CbiB